MPLAGDWVSIKWSLAMGYDAGFRGKQLSTAVAIMTAESNRYEEAYNTNADGSIDRGLFQINSVHDDQISPADAFNALKNTAYAFTLSKGGKDFSPWVAYTNGAYEQYLDDIQTIQALQTWRRRLPKLQERWGM